MTAGETGPLCLLLLSLLAATIPAARSACGPGSFACPDHTCFPLSALCNGVYDCLDSSDETSCPCTANSSFSCSPGLANATCLAPQLVCNGLPDCADSSDELHCQCTAGAFNCLSGECVPAAARCDGARDCADGSDEAGCPCPHNATFACSNGSCVPAALVCDGRDDCGDGGDEANCSCLADEFGCSERGPCIPRADRCDGVTDCPNGTDEADCAGCPAGVFACANGACASKSFVCDGVDDCGDYSDEMNCSCVPGEFTCSGGGECIPSLYVCDGDADCPDGSDEACNRCPTGSLTCANGACVSPSFACDGADDCGDYSDERNCSCGEDEFRCGGGECVPSVYRCDGDTDCPDGSDEGRCGACPPDLFQCGNRACTNPSFVCDGADDCGDYSDERNCSCAPGEFSCGGGLCVPSVYRCDGDTDCPDGSDEVRCSTCPPDLFQCGNGACANPSFVCDGADDCGDYSDEQNCSCGQDEFRCGGGECILSVYRCDGDTDCPDGSDEGRCSTCPPDLFQCGNGACTNLSFICDGADDCGDYSDEQNCSCGQDEFRCGGGECIPSVYRCDGDTDCPDGSDEGRCSTCPSHSFTCRNGSCISLLFVCNGVNDCGDYTDEQNCSTSTAGPTVTTAVTSLTVPHSVNPTVDVTGSMPTPSNTSNINTTTTAAMPHGSTVSPSAATSSNVSVPSVSSPVVGGNNTARPDSPSNTTLGGASSTPAGSSSGATESSASTVTLPSIVTNPSMVTLPSTVTNSSTSLVTTPTTVTSPSTVTNSSTSTSTLSVTSTVTSTGVDRCQPNPCHNSGQCQSDAALPLCQCGSDFLGDLCEIINYCAYQPCRHRATCINNASNYTCLCPIDFRGDTCQEEMNVYESTTRIEEKFDDRLKNESSDEFKQKKSILETSMTRNMQKELKNAKVVVISFSEGSIVVNSLIAVEATQNISMEMVQNTLRSVLAAVANDTHLPVNETYAQTSDYDECTVTNNDCSQFATCTNTVGSFNCTCLPLYLDAYLDSSPGRGCEVPRPPQNLSVLARSTTELNLTWVTPSSPVDGFVFRLARASSGQVVRSGLLQASELAYNGTGLLPGATYSFTIASYRRNATANLTGSGVQLNATTQPPMAVNVAASTGLSSINVTWDVPSGDVSFDSFNLSVAPADGATSPPEWQIPANSSSIGLRQRVVGLTWGTAYTVKLYTVSNNVKSSPAYPSNSNNGLLSTESCRSDGLAADAGCKDFNRYQATLKIKGDFTSDLGSPTSPAFLKLAGDLKNELNREMFIYLTAYVGVVVESFWNGSINANLRILLTPGSPPNPTDVMEALNKSAQQFKNISVLTVNVTDVDECQQKSSYCNVVAVCLNTQGSYSCSCPASYIDKNLSSPGQQCSDMCAAGYCEHAGKCEVNNNTPKCSCTSGYSGVKCETEDSYLGKVVGIPVGLSLAVIVLGLLGYLLYRRSRRRNTFSIDNPKPSRASKSEVFSSGRYSPMD